MADQQTTTTSSKSCDERNNQKTLLPLPKSSKAQILTKLAQNLSQSYQLVKQRQQKYNELITNMAESTTQLSSCTDSGGEGGDWQEVCSAKNKLKRKKQLSASLTSVTDSVNQEKRTRIEGIQLNCRGRLQINEITTSPQSCVAGVVRKATPTPEKISAAKPPLPPTKPETATATATTTQSVPAKVPPPRLKRKLQENMQTIQKLNALAEQLRLEINELKSSLTTERGAVRVLRAQNESETRKWKNEVKKLQSALELSKKSATSPANNSAKKVTEAITVEITPNAVGGLVHYEVQRLNNEILALKEANRALEEKKLINCDADRRKAADMRTLKDSYEIRLTQLTKSAKTEISRLLEELKTKERNVGQLKKELQVLQAKPQNEAKSRNATNNCTTKTMNQTTKKPKRISNKPNNETIPTKKEENKDLSQTQNPNEMKKLKDIEHINNTKNLQNNLNHKTTKILTNHSQNHKLKSLEINETQHKNIPNVENCNNLLQTTTSSTRTVTTTTTICNNGHEKEYYSMPHEITARLLDDTQETANKHQGNNLHEYRAKDNHSDSDSALSSAPPSISPQPPPAGLETADIWQMIRTYTTDIEKLQKDIDMLQKENEQLHMELNLAKEQILESEQTALKANNNTKYKQLMERIKYLEEQEHQLQAESNDIREQNELLEFRILELEETNDKWSLQSHVTPSSSSISTTSQSATLPTTKDVWACSKPNKDDPMQLLFGSSANTDSGITSPHSQHHIEDELNLMDVSNEELRQRILSMLRKSTLDEDDKHCLQQLLTLVQQLDMMSQRSGPNSINTASTSSSDEASSLDLVKSRISDYSSASSSSSARSTYDNSNASPAKTSKATTPNTNSRIVATVQPYNSHAPTNTPNESPRKTRHAWQSTSLSESGVFVESDFLSDASENNVCTQTDFEEPESEFGCHASKEPCSDIHKSQRYDSRRPYKVPAHSVLQLTANLSPSLGDQKRLQYYQDRLEVLEGKVLVYESSGDLQAKHLADRLQREIQLEKQLKELRDRVEFLECENSTLEEEKCEFEEAENDTRLRLQRLEIELEILSQRNVELEMSREALSAKYKDCRSECLILRDDLAASETQIRHIEEDKQQAKENLEFLHRVLPLLFIYNTITTASYPNKSQLHSAPSMGGDKMGNQLTNLDPYVRVSSPSKMDQQHGTCNCARDVQSLREEVKCLRHQIKGINSQHYEAMEAADSHWVELEREYKNREEAHRAKECSLKQKIQKLQDCIRDDARAANDKIQQLEEAEKELTCCVVRVSKEHRDIVSEHQSLSVDYERLKEQYDRMVDQQRPLNDALEQEKKRTKNLHDELNFMSKMQKETEAYNRNELDCMRAQLMNVKREFLHIEVTNGELREEVATLEQQIATLQRSATEYEDRIRCLTDEVRTKEEMCQKLEKQLERADGCSLAHELHGSPSKRIKRDEIKDLKTANKGLACALRNISECEHTLPSHQKFECVARNVKKLADALLHPEGSVDNEVSNDSLPLTDIAPSTPLASTSPVKELAVEVKPEPEVDVEKVKPEPAVKVEVNVEVEQEEPVAKEEDEPKSEISMTVAMALLPQFSIYNMSWLPSCSKQDSKKQICEVPSELRKLSRTDPNATTKPSKKPSKRKLRKQIFKKGTSTLQARVRRIVSCLSARRPQNFYDPYDVDVCQSELLQRISYESFHSVREEVVVEVKPKVDASTETVNEKLDKGTETFVPKKESSVQVNDEMNSEKLLEVIPMRIRIFVNMLKASVSHTDLQKHAFNINLMKRWNADAEFREGLEILQAFSAHDLDPSGSVTLENYEQFVNAMACLHVLEEIFKPLKIPILQRIEDQVNNQLMDFHSRKMESEFYCTVYYPVQRPVHPDLLNK